jgi:hypothetical protein
MYNQNSFPERMMKTAVINPASLMGSSAADEAIQPGID